MSASEALGKHVDQRRCPKCDNWHAIAPLLKKTAIRPRVLTVDGGAALPPSRSVPIRRLLVRAFFRSTTRSGNLSAKVV